MTGIDLSESLLEKAKEKAKQNGVRIDFLKHDARNLPFDEQFDVAIMMCEGGFPLMETENKKAIFQQKQIRRTIHNMEIILKVGIK